MRPLRTLALAGASAVLLMSQAVSALACEEHETAALTAPARSATAKYHSLTVTKKAGYSILADSAGITCIAEPEMGAMGVHYVKGDLVKDPAIDATHPEALVYAPDPHGGLHLAALEYVVIKSDWDANHPGPPPSLGVGVRTPPAPPWLFGHEFNFTDAPNRYGLPPFYSLHAWIWKDNPMGTFEMWNPSVTCNG
jgi:hypothetical protein